MYPIPAKSIAPDANATFAAVPESKNRNSKSIPKSSNSYLNSSSSMAKVLSLATLIVPTLIFSGYLVSLVSFLQAVKNSDIININDTL